MMMCLTNLVHGEEGATMVEYGLMLAFIAAVCVVAVTVLGPQVSGLFAAVPPDLP